MYLEAEVVCSKELHAKTAVRLPKSRPRPSVIDNVKARRDKALAHTDKGHFNNPTSTYKKYPVGMREVDDLLTMAGEILRVHHVHLLRADATMKVISGTNVDAVLSATRAFRRFWSDHRRLTKCGIRPADYIAEVFPPKP